MNDLTKNVRTEFTRIAKTLGVQRRERNALAEQIQANLVVVSPQGDTHVRLQICGDTVELGTREGEVRVMSVVREPDPHGRPRCQTRLVRTPHNSLRSLLEYYALRG
jgi:hypothetical protein